LTDDPIREHLAAMRRELGRLGSVRRRRLLAEVEDHLREAAAELAANGAEPGEAARRAVEAFGGSGSLAGSTTSPRMRVGVGAVVAIAALAGSFAIRDSQTAPIRPAQRAAVRTSPAALIRSIERGLSDGVVSAILGPPPLGFHKQRRSPWLYVRVRCLTGSGCVRGQWEAQMLAAAYHVTAPRHGLRPESGTSVYAGVENIDALEHERGTGGSGPVHTLRPGTESPVPFTPTPLPARVLTAEITSRLRSVHLTPVSISFDRVDGYLAPVILADAPYPRIVVRHPPQWEDAVGREPNGFEGVYLQVDFPDGRPAMAIGISSRTAEGLSWTKPSLNPNLGDP
jgi:hypothetical protein